MPIFLILMLSVCSWSQDHLFLGSPDPVRIGIRISPRIDTVFVPGMTDLSAEIIPAELPDSIKQILLQKIRWRFDSQTTSPGDSLLDSLGFQVRIFRTACCKSLYVIASLFDTARISTVEDTAEIISLPDSVTWMSGFFKSALIDYFSPRIAICNGSIRVAFSSAVPLRSAQVSLIDINGKSITKRCFLGPTIGEEPIFFNLEKKAKRMLLLRFSGVTIKGNHFEFIAKKAILQ